MTERVLDLFSGRGGWSQPWLDEGHHVTRVDLDPRFAPDIEADVLTLGPEDLRGFTVWLASPPCEALSRASIGHHWTGGKHGYVPATEQARTAIRLMEHTVWLMQQVAPKVAVIENPLGMARKVVPALDFIERVTVSYCRYGESRMKPTDLWGLPFPASWRPRPMCRNGHPDHERAPRGSKTGTQGIGNAADRALVPYELARDIMVATLAG